MDDERARTIRLPQWLWDEIDRDSIRAKRSAVKQMEVVLAAYYRGDATGLATDGLNAMEATRQPDNIKRLPTAPQGVENTLRQIYLDLQKVLQAREGIKVEFMELPISSRDEEEGEQGDQKKQWK